MNKFSIAIIAGGMSRRFGSEKSFAMIHGKPFYLHCLEKAKLLSDDLMLISKNSSKYPEFNSIRKIDDLFPHIQTPLVGIYTASIYAKYEDLFIWSVDAPLLKPEIIKIISDNIKSYDACIPKIDDKIHPLLGFYKKSISEKLKALIENKLLKVTSFLDKINTLYIDNKFFECADPKLTSFSNINTPEDLNKIVEEI